MPERGLGDRRGQVRFEIMGQQWGSLESLEPLGLANVTAAGALLEAPLPLPVDSVHRIQLGSADTPHHVSVRVRHVTAPSAEEPGAYLVGVEFLDPSPAAREWVNRLIEGSARAVHREEAAP